MCKPLIIEGLEFRLTCGACPEQYDVYKGVEQVGYVRLRFGVLTCDYPNVYGDIIFDCEYGGAWCGEFESYEDRMHHLGLIAKAINGMLMRGDDNVKGQGVEV